MATPDRREDEDVPQLDDSLLQANSRLPFFVQATLHASHLPRRDLLRGRAAKESLGGGRVRISSSASVPRLTASKGQLEAFARAVLEDLEQVDGAISQQSLSRPTPGHKDHRGALALSSAAARMPRHPPKTITSSASSSSLAASAVGLGSTSSANLYSCSNMSFGSVSSVSNLSASSSTRPELVASRSDASVGRMHRTTQRTRLDERIERIDSYPGLREPPPRFLARYDSPKYSMAAEAGAEERRKKHAAARAEAEEAARAKPSPSPAQAEVSTAARAAAAAASAGGGSSGRTIIGPYTVRLWELDPPPVPPPPKRPVTGLDQLASGTGIGAALAASPRHQQARAHSHARRPNTGGGFLQSKRDAGASQASHASGASGPSGDGSRDGLERSASAPFGLARSSSPLPPPSASGRSPPRSLSHHQRAAHRPETALAALGAATGGPPPVRGSLMAQSISANMSLPQHLSLVGCAAAAPPHAASSQAPDTPHAPPSSLVPTPPHTAQSCASTVGGGATPGLATPHLGGSGGSGGSGGAEIYRVEGYAPKESRVHTGAAAAGAGAPGEWRTEGEALGDAAAERVQGRGVMPMRISRRWAHTAPSQGLTRHNVTLPKAQPPAGFSPFLTQLSPDAIDAMGLQFSIAPTTGLAFGGDDAGANGPDTTPRQYSETPPNSRPDSVRRPDGVSDLIPPAGSGASPPTGTSCSSAHRVVV